MILIKNIFIFLLFFLLTFSIKANIKTYENTLKIHNEWINICIELTKNTPGYSAPVAARTFSHLSIAMYESVVEILPSNNSLSGQINDYYRTAWRKNNKNINYELLCNYIDYKMILHYFKNMPPSYKLKVENLYQSIRKKYSDCKLFSKNKTTKKYGDEMVLELINWGKKDGGDNSYNRNFPKSYSAPECEGCWVRTYPGYVTALQPYWGSNRLLIAKNKSVCDEIPLLKYSSDTNSQFHKEALKIDSLYSVINKNQLVISKYWDDGAGIAGTPVGHLYNIALNLSKKNKLTLKQTLELYCLLGIAINDAVIESWKLKYKYNLIRPITYIKKYINPQFNPAIKTPPFPEFPSGHSFQAGAASEVFKKVFGNDVLIIDSTHVLRTDINGESRIYTSISQLTEEMSTSRFYGGIHFEKTLSISLNYGSRIGKNTVNNLQISKP